MSPTAIYNYPNIAALAEWLSALPLEDEPTAPQRQASLPVEEFDAERILDDVRRMTEDELQTFIMQEMEKQ
jgi:hypothetical protein